MEITRDKLVLAICEAYTALEDGRNEDAKNVLREAYKQIKFPALIAPFYQAPKKHDIEPH